MSTGECMCRYKCEGKKCQSGQGMIWYSYKDCPHGCKCLPPAAVTPPLEKFIPAQSKDASLCSEDKPACGDEDSNTAATQAASPKSKISHSHRSEPAGAGRNAHDSEDSPPSFSHDEDEEDIDRADEEGHEDWHSQSSDVEPPTSLMESLLEWLDENARLVFGGAVVVFLTCTLLPTLLVVGFSGSGQGSNGRHPSSSVSSQETQNTASPSAAPTKQSPKDD